MTCGDECPSCAETAVIDAFGDTGFLSPKLTRDFRATLEPPTGTQIWLARYSGPKLLSAKVRVHGLTITSGRFGGYEFYLLTYQVGFLVIQFTYPRWTKAASRRPQGPFLTQNNIWDQVSIPIHPNVATAQVPPLKYLDDATLKEFHSRWADLRERIGT